jgi:hypothetical protein
VDYDYPLCQSQVSGPKADAEISFLECDKLCEVQSMLLVVHADTDIATFEDVGNEVAVLHRELVHNG